MKKEEFKKAIQDIRNIRMTSEEKSRIFARIIQEMQTTYEGRPLFVKSWWNIQSLRSQITHRPWLVATILMVFVVSGGNTLVMAAEGSLPGNILYPIKVSVIEPLRDNMADTPQDSVEWEITKVERRLVEAEQLASQNKLTPLQEKNLVARLDTHVTKVKTILDRNVKEETIDLDTVEVAFEASLNAHVAIFNEISSYVSNPSTQNAQEEGSIVKVARNRADEIRISKAQRINPNSIVEASVALMSVIAVDDTSIENRPMTKQADPTLNIEAKDDKVKIKSVDNARISDGYQKARIKTENLIESVSKNINIVTTKGNVGQSTFRKKIIDTSERTLEKARQSIREAEEHLKAGDATSAYTAVLDSERSAKEATIILRDGLKVDAEKVDKRKGEEENKKENTRLKQSEIKSKKLEETKDLPIRAREKD